MTPKAKEISTYGREKMTRLISMSSTALDRHKAEQREGQLFLFVALERSD
jgi:hypothetical protein